MAPGTLRGGKSVPSLSSLPGCVSPRRQENEGLFGSLISATNIFGGLSSQKKVQLGVR